MQAGKSKTQMDRFRKLMPSKVQELIYPEGLPADDSRMREYLALSLFKDQEGVWFIDHDTFFQAPVNDWFDRADLWFTEQGFVICTGSPRSGPGLTQPAYWLSPRNWPDGLSSFDPIPFQEKSYVRRPDLYTIDGELVLPQKDTLVQVYEELSSLKLAGVYPWSPIDGHPLSPLPENTHLGGIHLYTISLRQIEGLLSLNPEQSGWVANTLNQFDHFFGGLPQEWLAAEEPELLRRHQNLKNMLAFF
ncbi:MAG: hypothetical protein ACK2U1_04250 [Anaerolineales bacterium]|jgi:hypothetical protein